MANVVYGSPYQPPTPVVPAWSGLGMSWVAKGVEWALTDPRTGLFLLPGVRGLGSVTADRHFSSSPAAAGSRYSGTSVLDREVFWPVHIYSDAGSADWMLRDRAFWAGMDPLDTGVWTVTHPDGKHRSLELRFVSDGDHSAGNDPILRGWDTYGITLVAEQPYWVGDPVVNSFKAPPLPEPFFGTDGPVVNIASSYSVDNATMDNPGDVESYPRWYIDGETLVVGGDPSASVGVGDLVVSVPFAIPAGECLVIESDPGRIGATLYTISAEQMALDADQRKKPSERIVGVDLLDPVDVTADLGEADFGAIPPGESVPLSLTVSGTGTVEALLPTLYRRPW